MDIIHEHIEGHPYLFDLRRDPEPLLNLSINDLKVYLKKFSPKALRVIKTNKAPVVLDKKFALKEKAYADFDLETIQKRAKMVRNSENFCKNIQIINREAAEEKAQTQTQEDLLPEETLYEKFIPNNNRIWKHFIILKLANVLCSV